MRGWRTATGPMPVIRSLARNKEDGLHLLADHFIAA
jgi:hypothetical protein